MPSVTKETLEYSEDSDQVPQNMASGRALLCFQYNHIAGNFLKF